MGEVELAVPRTRHSGAPTEVVGRYKRRTDEVDRLVTTAYVQGVSTRDMTRLSQALMGEGISRSTVSRVTKVLGEQVEQLRHAPIDGSLADREELSRGLVAGDSLRMIATRLGRAPSTISREVAWNGRHAGVAPGAQRRPHMRTEQSGAGRLRNMILISDRPPEVEDRAVPGHWEGDLIIGKGGRSAIGTLVERTSRYVVLLHLPHGRTAEDVRAALTRQVSKLPAELRRTLTWDQGKEMADHVRFSTDTDMEVYFCDPHSPWQRGSNENTNGLLRQYFPEQGRPQLHSAAHLNAVARQLNNRPRQTLGLDETIRSVQPDCCVDRLRTTSVRPTSRRKLKVVKINPSICSMLAAGVVTTSGCVSVVVRDDISYGPGRVRYAGYSVEYVDATPAPGSVLREGSVVTMTVRVRYSLMGAERGRLQLQFDDEKGAPMLDGQAVAKDIVRTSSSVAEITHQFTVPKHRLDLVACVYVVPDGEKLGTGELRIRYPVGSRK